MTAPTGLLAGVSVSHQRAGIDDIDRASRRTQAEAVESLLEREGVREAFVLQTCNRAEAYVVTDDVETGREALVPYTRAVPGGAVLELDHEAGLRHLLRVAAGLESLVVGEDQILGQVSTAFEDAREAGGIGPILEDAVVKALRVGERARTETAINEGVTSLGSAAVALARQSLETDLADATALVVGTGEMGTLTARALEGNVERVLLANRTTETAEHLAGTLETDTEVRGLDALPGATDEAALVVTATASETPVLDAETLGDAGRTLVVDLAQPRDVPASVGELDGVTLRDLDALESVTEGTRTRRRAAAEAVEGIVEEELDRLVTQYKRKRADDVIAAMYEGAEELKARELDTAIARLEAADGELSEDQRAVVESLADALVGQLLAPPTRSLREAAENDDWATINTALQLFGPGLRPDPDQVARFLDGVDEVDVGGDGADGAVDKDEPEFPVDLPADASPEEIPEGVRERVPSSVLERLED
ncbi:MAG: glutamyl-tRNA reductase [Haloarculaceae archaeon]